MRGCLTGFVTTVKGPLNFDFKLSYFNTSSSKCLVDILDLLKKYQNDGGSVSVNWYYDDSEEELEEVEDFILETGLDINKIPMEV